MNFFPNDDVMPTGDTRRGFTLVIVLVILTLLAVITVAYLSSMATERATANAFSNKARAEQAAQAGVDSAMGILRDYFKAFPDSATVWDTAQSKNADGTTNEGTTLYLRAMPQSNDANTPDPAPGLDKPDYDHVEFTGGNNPSNGGPTGADARTTYVLPLVSGATFKPLESKSTALPAPTVGTYVNLNSRQRLDDSQGWIGTPPNYPNASLPKPVSVPWVEIKQQDGTTNPVIGRYAFWVEDESFRANISYAGLGTNHQRRDNTQNPTDPLKPMDCDLLGVLDVISPPPPANVSPDPNIPLAQSIFDARAFFPGKVFPETRGYKHSSGLSTDAINKLPYLTTTQSSALNLSRHGTQRLNLNALIDPSVSAQNQIDTLVKTIQLHLPKFGERFYRRTNVDPVPTALNDQLVGPDNRLIYLNKVAANIRDYIDKDVVPTIINNDGKVRSGPTSPLLAFGNGGVTGLNEIWAQGKDSAPCIEECASRFRGGPSADGLRYTLLIDHYIEVWNPTTRDVYASELGTNPVIRVANPTKWVASDKTDDPSTTSSDPFKTEITLPCDDPAPGNASPSATRDVKPPQRDFDIDITRGPDGMPNNLVFKAGVATVITTDPDFAEVITDSEARSHVYLCGFPNGSPGKRVYKGTMPYHPPWRIKTPPDPEILCNCLKMIFGGDPDPSHPKGSTSSSDYESEIVFYSAEGIIDCIQGGLPVYNNGGRITLPPSSGSPPPATLPIMGGSLRGNSNGTVSNLTYCSMTGDPRSNNEQLFYTLYSNGGELDQSRYFNSSGTAITLGLPDMNYVQPQNGTSPYIAWPDYALLNRVMTAANAPFVVANAPLTSVGQLGDVYDPARYTGFDSSGAKTGERINAARGGGRTFKIGQHDDLWDGSATNASRSWTSWRLADIFCVADAVEQPGLININGVARDGGAALRAALTGFKFQPAPTSPPSPGDSQLAGQTLKVDATTPGVQALVDQIKARFAATTGNTGTGPFFERGELSELPAFGRNAVANTELAGVDMGKVFDRGREELFRRLVEMTTTRGNVFTVYALGQSITLDPGNANTKRITGTHQMRVTFKLVPKTRTGGNFYPANDPGSSAANFDPAIRFAKPDHYDVQVLSASSGNS